MLRPGTPEDAIATASGCFCSDAIPKQLTGIGIAVAAGYATAWFTRELQLRRRRWARSPLTTASSARSSSTNNTVTNC